MKEEKLFDAFGQIDENLIEEATPGKRTVHKKKNKYGAWLKWSTTAACAVILIGVTIPVYVSLENKAGDDQASYDNGTETNDGMSYTHGSMTENTESETDDGYPFDTDDYELDWGITLSAEDITPTGLTLVITQEGGDITGELGYGEEYSLEIIKDGQWISVPYIVDGGVAWNELAYTVSMNDSVEKNLWWEMMYGELEPGIYRLSKSFKDYREPGDFDEQNYYVKFEIK